MNFYGHSVLAATQARDTAEVLGSMLPDFEGMAGTRLLGVRDEAVSRGVAFHHETDDRFHGAAPFIEGCGMLVAALSRAGLGRGSARAAAHVALELTFDGLLLDRLGPSAPYLAALDLGHPDAHGAALDFADGGVRFEALRRRLVSYGMPVGYREPGFVAERVRDALSRRPRLAFASDDDRLRLEETLHALRVPLVQTGEAIAVQVGFGDLMRFAGDEPTPPR